MSLQIYLQKDVEVEQSVFNDNNVKERTMKFQGQGWFWTFFDKKRNARLAINMQGSFLGRSLMILSHNIIVGEV